MGGYSRNEKLRLGLIALIALRRAKAEQARRTTAENSTSPAETADPVARPKKKRGWFG